MLSSANAPLIAIAARTVRINFPVHRLCRSHSLRNPTQLAPTAGRSTHEQPIKVNARNLDLRCFLSARNMSNVSSTGSVNCSTCKWPETRTLARRCALVEWCTASGPCERKNVHVSRYCRSLVGLSRFSVLDEFAQLQKCAVVVWLLICVI